MLYMRFRIECGVFYMLDWRFTAMCYNITMRVLLCHTKYQLLANWSTTENLKPEFRCQETTLLFLSHSTQLGERGSSNGFYALVSDSPKEYMTLTEP